LEIQQDKILHFLFSLGLVIILHIKSKILDSILITVLIGLTKEVYDIYFGEGFSSGDLLADMSGILIGIILILFLGGGINV
jgi:VanZ family protein